MPTPVRSQRAQRSQRGSILPLVALALVIAGGAAVLLGRLGEAAVSRAAAQTAADAAALAGAAEGEDAARQVASANGATVVRFEVLGDDTRVTVEVGPARAVGRARAARAAAGGAQPARGGP